MSNQRDNQPPQQQSADQMNEEFSDNAEQEFVYTEEAKPFNRNLLVLLLIAAVGGSLVYLMYLRGRFTAGDETIALMKDQDTVNTFIKSANQDMQKLEDQLAKTKSTVESLQADPGKGQVLDLKGNPFGEPKAPKAAPAQGSPIPRSDPADEVNGALQKVKVEMIVVAGSSSSVQINNWVYKVGDTITVDAVTFAVKAISRDGVVLKHPLGDFKVGTASSKGL